MNIAATEEAMRPFSVTISRVRCFSITDFTGSDDLVGEIGPVRFDIGSFTPGNDFNVDVNQIVPAGELFLRILEKDVGGDDEIGIIDLSGIMDIQTVVNVQGEGASYDLTLFVQSVSD